MHNKKNSLFSQEEFALAKKISSMNIRSKRDFKRSSFPSLFNIKNNILQSIKSDYSTQLLLLTNIVIFLLAIFQNWPFSTLIATYFIQSLIIGFFHFFRIFFVKNGSKEEKVFLAIFFLIHYGIFHIVYFAFLKVLFLKEISIPAIILPSILFFINHLFSSFYNKSTDKKIQQSTIQIFFEPYLRIIPMHLIIIFGGIISFSASLFGSIIVNQILLIVFLLMKITIDLTQHVNQHQNNGV